MAGGEGEGGLLAAQHAGGACLWLHLLLPVRGDSQRVPNGAEALGELKMALQLLQAAESRPSLRYTGSRISWYLPSRCWPTGFPQSLRLTIKSAACEFPKLRAPCALIQAAHLMAPDYSGHSRPLV